MSNDLIKLKNYRYLFAHQAWAPTTAEKYKLLTEHHRQHGFDVTSFCLVQNPPGPHYTIQQLHSLWRKRDPKVIELHDRLVEAASEADILINFNGANIHPEWLKELPTFNVYICWDDPESTAQLSAPVAKYFDFAFTGNIACLPLYQSWGIHRSDFLPMGYTDHDIDHSITVERILEDERENEIVFLGERESSWRRERLDRLMASFPQAIIRGKGWPGGYLPAEDKLPLYTHTKIGWNIHNSVGPVNLRTYALPANGVMEICDNKCRLGQLFELGKEVIGFDTIEECIDLTHYYLAHDQERKEIAARGFERARRDYNEDKQWELILSGIAPFVDLKQAGKLDTPQFISPDGYRRTFKSFLIGGYRRVIGSPLQKAGIEIRRTTNATSSIQGESSIRVNPAEPYLENQQSGPGSMEAKKGRVSSGGFFEWPNMVALNWAVATLVGSKKRIIELGGGTGCFAYEAAADPNRVVVCSELDTEASDWAQANRNRANILYINRSPRTEDGPFDLVVSIEVIEHISDYLSFLKTCIELAPCAIITTPNKNRDQQAASVSPPVYEKHVREWTAGEFYWVLRTFYEQVKLFAMPNVYIPEVVPIRVDESMTPLIAICENPY
jgi:spore maturation protein CgeB